MIEFEAGQVWRYRHRRGEEQSRIIICKVESDATLGGIVHIHVRDLSIHSPNAPGGMSHVISHMPFSEASLRDSVTELESEEELPDFEEGYAMWKEAFDNGEGGVFTVSVAESVDFMERALG